MINVPVLFQDICCFKQLFAMIVKYETRQCLFNAIMSANMFRYLLYQPVFRIRMSLNADQNPDAGFNLNANPDTDSDPRSFFA